MERALVVLTSDDPDETLLDAARQYMVGLDAELVLLRIHDKDEFEADVQRNARAGRTTDTIDDIEVNAKREADEVGAEAFDDAISFVSRGELGAVPSDILRIAEEMDVDHIFVSGRRRSPTSKLIAGDVAQKIILNFDGPVTVTTRTA